MTDWQDIETAPKDGTCIRLRYRDSLGYFGGGVRTSWDGAGWVINTDHGQIPIGPLPPTHWRPAPEPPMDGEQP